MQIQGKVRRKKGFVYHFKDVFAVSAAGGPVHQPGRFKGCLVNPLHANLSRHKARNGDIFVSGDGSIQRNIDTKPGRFVAVLARGMNAAPPVLGRYSAECLLRLPRRDIVEVKRDGISAGDGAGPSARP